MYMQLFADKALRLNPVYLAMQAERVIRQCGNFIAKNIKIKHNIQGDL